MGLRDATQILTGWPAFVDLCKHLVLPMITLVILSIGGMMRYTRTNMLEVMNSEYIRTARPRACLKRIPSFISMRSATRSFRS